MLSGGLSTAISRYSNDPQYIHIKMLNIVCF
nr:MAG TPA: hypothetical protein [Caudoviricetes sp.]